MPMQTSTDPRWVRAVHDVAGGVATALWRTADAIQRASDATEFVADRVNDLGHKALEFACKVTDPLAGVDR